MKFIYGNVLPFLRRFRSQRSNFGAYEIVEPGVVSQQLIIPDHIPKPSYYLTGVPTDEVVEPDIKTDQDVTRMLDACKLAANILKKVEENIKVGQSTDEIDKFVHNLTIKSGAYPSPFNYRLFPKSVCTSVNNVACHGIPDGRQLKDGDIINIDITVFYHGFHGDCSKTFLIGNVDETGRTLVTATEICLNEAIDICKPGRRFADIGNCIQDYADKLGFEVVPAFLGHGLGKYFHGPPDIYHFRNNYPGAMESGMTFTIEPILSQGTKEIEILDDNWTAVTTDGSRTAQFEHTVLITDTGVKILTIPE